MDLTGATRGYTYVTSAAALFAVNGSVSKVVLESGLEPAWLAALRCTGAAVEVRPTARRPSLDDAA